VELFNLYKFNFQENIFDSLLKTDKLEEFLKIEKKLWVYTHGENIEYLAYRIYGDVNFWVLLCIYNDIVDPLVVPNKLYFVDRTDIIRIFNE
jgi:hypothetical protein